MSSEQKQIVEDAKTIAQHTVDTVRDTEKLVERVQDADKALEILATMFKRSWLEFMQTTEVRLTEFRQLRMSTETEIHRVMTDLKDVRKFFLSPEHDTEVARLKEFVELCERLKALKESGFLDRVSDTILRLEEKP